MNIATPLTFIRMKNVVPADAICQCDKSTKYLWNKKSLVGEELNKTLFDFYACDKAPLCICDIYDNCYETKKYSFSLVQIVCTDTNHTECFIEATMDPGQPLINIYNSSEIIPNVVKVKSMSCSGCGSIMDKNTKCYKIPGSKVTPQQLYPYTALEYTDNTGSYTLWDVVSPNYVSTTWELAVNLMEWFCGYFWYSNNMPIVIHMLVDSEKSIFNVDLRGYLCFHC
uniref:Uncharacterized protein n=1 Tax=Acrobeloides nanus TaxID=290746 RepID=A0A914EMP4_9BILA